MNNTWKLSILGAVALAASSAVMAIGCTVTTTSGPLGDGGADGSVTDGGSGDSATADSGDGGVANSCQAQCPIIDKEQFGKIIGFDTDDAGNYSACGTCDKCSAAKCCAEVTKCFAAVNGAKSDCESLFDCIIGCGTADGGDACKAACKAAYDVDGGNPAYEALTAADNCQNTTCMAECN